MILSRLYRQAVLRRHLRFDNGRIEQCRVKWPVISVGGIEAGGSGKTPVVIELIRFLKDSGYLPVLLSRGYGRSNREPLLVNSGEYPDTTFAGDEPSLILKKTSAAALISAERWQDAQMVSRIKGDNKVIVMDDGFQHRRLQRDIDIVTLTGGISIAERRYLPCSTRGQFSLSLRDVPERLASADIILMKGALVDDISKYTDAPSYVFRYRFSTIPDIDRAIAVTSIASGAGFVSMLRDSGIEIVAHKSFRDHHRFSRRDLGRIEKTAQKASAAGILVTEKDAERLPDHIGAFPIIPVAIELDIPAGFWEVLSDMEVFHA